MAAKRTAAWIVIALLAGIAAGSAGRLFGLFGQRDAISATGETLPDRPAVASAATAGETAVQSGPASDENIVIASGGAAFEPYYRNGGFIGYRVVRNEDDTRFGIGDVIVRIDEAPVEGSAAGGELLIIALMNPQARIDVLEQ